MFDGNCETKVEGIPYQRWRRCCGRLILTPPTNWMYGARLREFDTLYPLATAKPYVLGKELVLELQEKNGIPPAIAIVIRSGQQILLAQDAHRFFKKIESDPPNQGDVRRLHPAGRVSPVVIDPLG